MEPNCVTMSCSSEANKRRKKSTPKGSKKDLGSHKSMRHHHVEPEIAPLMMPYRTIEGKSIGHHSVAPEIAPLMMGSPKIVKSQAFASESRQYSADPLACLATIQPRFWVYFQFFLAANDVRQQVEKVYSIMMEALVTFEETRHFEENENLKLVEATLVAIDDEENNYCDFIMKVVKSQQNEVGVAIKTQGGDKSSQILTYFWWHLQNQLEKEPFHPNYQEADVVDDDDDDEDSDGETSDDDDDDETEYEDEEDEEVDEESVEMSVNYAEERGVLDTAMHTLQNHESMKESHVMNTLRQLSAAVKHKVNRDEVLKRGLDLNLIFDFLQIFNWHVAVIVWVQLILERCNHKFDDTQQIVLTNELERRLQKENNSTRVELFKKTQESDEKNDKLKQSLVGQHFLKLCEMALTETTVEEMMNRYREDIGF